MKNILTHTMLGLLILVSMIGHAQEKEGQIKVKITRDVDGEQKTYEGTYETEEQMRADKDLEEFMGGEGFKTNFWFGGVQNGSFEVDEDESGNRFMFHFDDEEGPHQFQFQHNDSSLKAFEMHMEELVKNFEGMDEEKEKRLLVIQEKFEDMDFDFDFADSLARKIEIQLSDQMKDMERNIEVRVNKHIEITDDVGDEFGNKGTVKESNKLELLDLNFFPNPAPNGQFKLRFKTLEPGELAIKIFNLSGKEVFNRSFENFQGLYSESIDLSRQSEGIYLLEIQQDDKRLTRKVIVN